MGGFLGATTWFGPWAKNLTCDSVIGFFDMFMTHFDFDFTTVEVVVVDLELVVGSYDVVPLSGVVLAVVLKLWVLLWYMSVFLLLCYLYLGMFGFEQPPLFTGSSFLINLSNFAFCLISILWCLSCLILTIILSHSAMVSQSSTLFSSLLHVWHWHSSISVVLLMVLILPFNNALSVFLVILMALGVLILLLSLKLTGMLLSRHLRVNLLWFLKSAIFFLLLSHFCQCFTLSWLYSLHI